MPTPRRQQYTRPIPEDAVPCTMKVPGRRGSNETIPAVKFKGTDGKPVVAPVVQDGKQAGTHCRVFSPYFYGSVGGNVVRLTTELKSSDQMLARLIARHANGDLAPVDSEAKRTPLRELLDEFLAYLKGKNDSPFHVRMTGDRCLAAINGCGWRTVEDVSALSLGKWLAEQRDGKAAPVLPDDRETFTRSEVAELLGVGLHAVTDTVRRQGLAAIGEGRARRYPRETVQALIDRGARGISPQTSNHYRSALVAFGRWLVKAKKLSRNELEDAPRLRVEADVRHRRRELSADELQRLLVTTRTSSKTFRGLDGNARFHLYALACGTGLRVGGLASLTPASFALAADPPAVVLSARSNKSRKTKTQPLPPDVADLMRAFLKGRPAGKPLWPGRWATDHRAAEMLRADLKAAGVPYKVTGPDGDEQHADFHALRHGYLSALSRNVGDLRTIQELAGHSSITTTQRYLHRHGLELGAAVAKLPAIVPG